VSDLTRWKRASISFNSKSKSLISLVNLTDSRLGKTKNGIFFALQGVLQLTFRDFNIEPRARRKSTTKYIGTSCEETANLCSVAQGRVKRRTRASQ
jgi:hypothetical protein